MPDEERFPEPPSDEDIAERLRKVREELSEMELPDVPDDEIDAKRQRLADSIGHQDLPHPPDWDYRRPPQKKPEDDAVAYRGLGVGMSVAYSLVGCVVVGWGIGKLIDMATGGVLGQAFGALIGAVGGLAASIMMIIRTGNQDK